MISKWKSVTSMNSPSEGDFQHLVNHMSNNPCMFLLIEGYSKKANLTAARRVLNRDEGARHVQLSLRGNGKVSFRMRCPGGKWRYFNGPSFRPSGSARYVKSVFPSWKQLRMALPQGCAEIELEIRAGKKEWFEFWMHDVSCK